jgi:hypothetical protein
MLGFIKERGKFIKTFIIAATMITSYGRGKNGVGDQHEALD